MERSKKAKRVTITLPPRLFAELEELVRSGRYLSRSAAVGEAVRQLLQRELPLVARQKREAEEG